MSKAKDPYDECATCKTLADCPYPDVQDDMFGSPMPPDVCPKPIEIMAHTLRREKVIKVINNGLS